MRTCNEALLIMLSSQPAKQLQPSLPHRPCRQSLVHDHEQEGRCGSVVKTCHETQLNMLALLKQRGPNPIVRLTVCVIDLSGSPEMMQSCLPVAVAPL